MKLSAYKEWSHSGKVDLPTELARRPFLARDVEICKIPGTV